MAGLRIGWLATHDRDLLARLAAFKDYTTICSSAPSEILSIIALRARCQVLARSRGHHRRQPRAARRLLRRLGRSVHLGPAPRWLDRVRAADRPGRPDRRLGRRARRRPRASCSPRVPCSSTRAITSGSASAGPICLRRSAASRRSPKGRSVDPVGPPRKLAGSTERPPSRRPRRGRQRPTRATTRRCRRGRSRGEASAARRGAPTARDGRGRWRRPTPAPMRRSPAVIPVESQPGLESISATPTPTASATTNAIGRRRSAITS